MNLYVRTYIHNDNTNTLCIKNIKFYYASSIFLAFVRFQSNSDFPPSFLTLLTIHRANMWTYILSRALNFPKHNNFSQSRGRETRNVDVKARKASSKENIVSTWFSNACLGTQQVKLGVVRKLRHARRRTFSNHPPPCHKFPKKKLLLGLSQIHLPPKSVT